MVLLPLAVILTSQLAAAPAPAPSRPSLVAAEYAFAERTAKDGIRAGFMGAMRPDATIFIPRPVNGPTYYKTQLELGALLSWRPAVAEASQAGDLGYCSGPYTFQVAKDAPVAAYGWFVTVWQREGKEPWKLRLEIGIPTPDPAGRPEVQFLPRAEAQPPALEGAATGNPAEILEVDRAFAKDAARNLTQAYQTRVDANVRFYRKGRFPVEGAKALAAALDLDAVAWEPQEAWVASSNDLACTRGTLTHTGQDGKVECQYVRMWKKQGSAWKLALDLELAQPAAK